MDNLPIIILVVVVAALGVSRFRAARARVDGASARQLVEGGATLLDVRTDREFSSGHLDGARHIPLAQLRGRIGELPRDRPVVVDCLSGERSASAAGVLRDAGFDVHDLGPMRAW